MNTNFKIVKSIIKSYQEFPTDWRVANSYYNSVELVHDKAPLRITFSRKFKISTQVTCFSGGLNTTYDLPHIYSFILNCSSRSFYNWLKKNEEAKDNKNKQVKIMAELEKITYPEKFIHDL